MKWWRGCHNATILLQSILMDISTITNTGKGRSIRFYYRKKGEEEELILNVNELAKPHAYYNVSGLHTQYE